MLSSNSYNSVLDALWRSRWTEPTVPVPYFKWKLDQEVTVGLALAAATQRLGSARVDTPRLDSELLLAHSLGCSKTELYAYPERPLTGDERERFEDLVERRFRREPVAYLVGRKAFYGLDLAVNHHVLIPRPETELLVDLSLDFVARKAGLNGHGPQARNGHGPRGIPTVRVADVGTGSGAIALALAHHSPHVQVFALDISQLALDLATRNAQHHDLQGQIRFLQGDLLEPLPGPVDLVVANLPYVARHEWSALEPDIAAYEPSLALDGGADGLAVIGRLLSQAPKYLAPSGTLLLEIGAAQGDGTIALAERYFPEALVEVLPDYGELDRIVRVQL